MILYLSHSRLKNSVNAVYIKGLIKAGEVVQSFYIKKSPAGYLDAIKKIFKYKPKFVIVGYDSPHLVIFCRFFTRKKIIYNALCSVYERLIVARALYSKLSLHSFYFWTLDFIAVKLADLVMLETDRQVDYFIKLFRSPRRKLIRAWTGVDEDVFFRDPLISKPETFTVLFRGSLMPESGAEFVARAAKILENENIKFIMQSGGIGLDKIKNLVEELKPRNLELRSDFMSEEDLRIAMQKCHLLLGQLSDHPRLDRTIPHKAFEALAMRLPYLTAANRGILELLKDGETCITCRPADAKSLAEKILWSRNNPGEIERIAENGYKLFREELTVEKLGRTLKSCLDKLSV